MKKIFYIIASAIVALGAVACQNDIEEGIKPENKGEGLSFTAEIADITRIAVLDSDDANYDKKLVWEGGETIVVNGDEDKTFNFTNTEENPYLFSCAEEGVETLKNGTRTLTFKQEGNHEAGPAKTIILGGGIDFTQENPKAQISLVGGGLIFHFNCTEETVLKWYCPTEEDCGYFDGSEAEKTFAAGEHYISVEGGSNDDVTRQMTLEAWIGGVKIKTITRIFNDGKIYNLGEIKPEVCDFTIVGGHQGWDTANGDAMYKIADSNTYMRANVTLTDAGFKFYNATTEIITVEHPAVTTGEEGDWYLQPNANWKKDGARFAIYFFDDSKGYKDWVSMKDDNGDGIYVANNPDTGLTYQKMIFCRMNPANPTNDWTNKWNQTGDLVIAEAGSNNCYAVKEGTWDNGDKSCWKVHTPEIKDAWTEEVEQVTEYWFGMGEGFDITNWVDGWTNNYGGDNIVVADTAKTYDIYFYHETMQDWGGFGFSYVVLEHGSAAPALK